MIETYDLNEIPPMIESLTEQIRNFSPDAGLAPDALQYLLLAQDTLKQAKRFAELASIAQSRELASMRR